MGRKKSRTKEFIEDERQRVATHKKRKVNLLKKAQELETLCGIQLCIIISGPKLSGNARNAPVTIFPTDAEKAGTVIQNFKNATMNKSHRTLTLPEVLNYGPKKQQQQQQPKTAANKPSDNDNSGSLYDHVRKLPLLPLPQLEALLVSVTEKLKHVNAIEEDRKANLCNIMVPSTYYDPYVMDHGTNFYYQNPTFPNDPHSHPNSNSMTMMMMSQDDFDFSCQRDHLNSINPYSNLMMKSDDDFGARFMKQSQIEGMTFNGEVSNNGYFPYNVPHVPQYGNDVSSFTDLSMGVVSNNSRILNNLSTPMWYLATHNVGDEEGEAKFGGFRG